MLRGDGDSDRGVEFADTDSRCRPSKDAGAPISMSLTWRSFRCRVSRGCCCFPRQSGDEEEEEEEESRRAQRWLISRKTRFCLDGEEGEDLGEVEE